MIEIYYSPDADLERLRAGPLGAHLDGFARWLSDQGYARQTGHAKIRLVADFSRWLERRQLGIAALTEALVKEFSKGRKKQGSWCRGDGSTLTQLLGYLRATDLIARPSDPASDHPRDRLLQEYAQFLQSQRGLNPVTIDSYLPKIRRFLEARFDTQSVRWDQLRVHDVTEFMVAQSAQFSPKSAQLTATALRSFLGFLLQAGQITTNLAASVPRIASWPLSQLPQFLEPAQVERLLSHCDQNRPTGRRDYAVLLLLARLGLRAGEVTQLTLEDINWEAGEILIRGKSDHQDRLPLLPDVGQALANYLKQDRPTCACRRVFLRRVAPCRGFANAVAVCTIVRRALKRAQLDPEHKGAHLLRRSLATQMLRQGASLTQIGQILRHRLAQTTEIYAKVDVAALRALAQPWPGGGA